MTDPIRPVMLITGGSGSIGGEIARQALAAGWRVVLHGRDDAVLRQRVESLVAAQPQATVEGISADIRAGRQAVTDLVDAAGQRFGRLDAVVDCLVTGPAEGRIVGGFEDTEPAAYLPLAELSIVSLEWLAHAALPWLRDSRGCLVAFASDAGLFAAPGQTLIGAMRAATVGFVRNLAMDIARDGVRVHCVSPSFVEDTTTAERLAATRPERLEKARKRAGLGLPTPADIAPLVLFLCGDGARRMTGQVISVNGGLNA